MSLLRTLLAILASLALGTFALPSAALAQDWDPWLSQASTLDDSRAPANPDPPFPSEPVLESAPKTRPKARVLPRTLRDARRVLAKEGIRGALQESLNEDLVVLLTVTRNPDIEAAKRGIETVESRYSLGDYVDHLVREYGSLFEGSNSPLAGSSLARVEKDPSGEGELSSLSRLYDVERKMAVEKAGLVSRRKVTAARLAYADYYRASASLLPLNKTVTVLEDTRRLAENRVAVGSAKASVLLQLENRILSVESQITDLEKERDDARERLLSLMNLPGTSALGLPSLPVWRGAVLNSADLYKQARNRRHEVRLAKLALEKVQETIVLMKTRAVPPLSASWSKAESPGVSPMQSGFQTVIEEMESRLKEMKSHLESAGDDATLATDRALVGYNGALKNWKLATGPMMKRAQRLNDLAMEEFRSGRGSLTDYLEAEELVLQLELRALRYEGNALFALAMLRDATASFSVFKSQ